MAYDTGGPPATLSTVMGCHGERRHGAFFHRHPVASMVPSAHEVLGSIQHYPGPIQRYLQRYRPWWELVIG